MFPASRERRFNNFRKSFSLASPEGLARVYLTPTGALGAKLLMSPIICIQEHVVGVFSRGLFMRIINVQLIGKVPSRALRQERMASCGRALLCVCVALSRTVTHLFSRCVARRLPARLPER